MMNDRLYNIHRPTTFDEVIGNSNNTEVLKGIISKKTFRYKREYLFHSDLGGVGKTTSALIFAKAINCENPIYGNPCNKCKHCVDFDNNNYQDMISLNGAKYNTVDKVKPIIDLSYQYPVRPDGYRVVVIDEFQRMSPQAMSEFLDLFEFGQNKTIFILTTTNIDTILQPILTRCLKLQFLRPPSSEVIGYLESILEKTNIPYDVDNVSKIVTTSGGSIRESLSIMEKYVMAYGSLTVDVKIESDIDYFVYLITKAITSGVSTVEQQFYSISSHVLDVIPSVLFEILYYDKVDYHSISKKVYNQCFPILRDVLMDITESYLKFKPSGHADLLLWLGMFEHENLNVRVAEIPDDVDTDDLEYDDSFTDDSKSEEDSEPTDIITIMRNNGFEVGKVPEIFNGVNR